MLNYKLCDLRLSMLNYKLCDLRLRYKLRDRMISRVKLTNIKVKLDKICDTLWLNF